MNVSHASRILYVLNGLLDKHRPIARFGLRGVYRPGQYARKSQYISSCSDWQDWTSLPSYPAY